MFGKANYQYRCFFLFCFFSLLSFVQKHLQVHVQLSCICPSVFCLFVCCLCVFCFFPKPSLCFLMYWQLIRPLFVLFGTWSCCLKMYMAENVCPSIHSFIFRGMTAGACSSKSQLARYTLDSPLQGRRSEVFSYHPNMHALARGCGSQSTKDQAEIWSENPYCSVLTVGQYCMYLPEKLFEGDRSRHHVFSALLVM